MNLLVLSCNGYPSREQLYNNAWVHTRARAYQHAGHRCIVHVPKRDPRRARSYEFDGVRVEVGDFVRLEALKVELAPDALLVHSLHRRVMRFLTRGCPSLPVVVWVHGGEALSWRRRLYDFRVSKSFFRRALKNTVQRRTFRRFASGSAAAGFHYVFVSKWMREIARRDVGYAFPNSTIIPNPVDEDLFGGAPKNPEHRGRVLLIRPFASRKYANDWAMAAVQRLASRPCFADLRFSIYGSGRDFHHLVGPLRGFANVEVHERFLAQSEIPGVHRDHGVFLCPTRQDAQGVSMCEAMMGGLVPVTTRCTAIPEFVEDGSSGFLTADAEGLAAAIELLHADPETFLAMSRKAMASIRELAGLKGVVERELALVAAMAEQQRTDVTA